MTTTFSPVLQPRNYATLPALPQQRWFCGRSRPVILHVGSWKARARESCPFPPARNGFLRREALNFLHFRTFRRAMRARGTFHPFRAWRRGVWGRLVWGVAFIHAAVRRGFPSPFGLSLSKPCPSLGLPYPEDGRCLDVARHERGWGIGAKPPRALRLCANQRPCVTPAEAGVSRVGARDASLRWHDDLGNPQLSRNLPMRSTKLQGLNRLSSWWTRMCSQASAQAPVEPGMAKI